MTPARNKSAYNLQTVNDDDNLNDYSYAAHDEIMFPMGKQRMTRMKNIREDQEKEKLGYKELPKKPKFNLNPRYQHVKSQFMNTSRSVAKLRKEAAEKKAELRRQKEIFNKERATHWIPHTEKKKKRPKSANKPKTREEYEEQ